MARDECTGRNSELKVWVVGHCASGRTDDKVMGRAVVLVECRLNADPNKFQEVGQC